MIKILIGPQFVGKSSIGIALAKSFKEQYSDFNDFVDDMLDDDDYVQENGIESYRFEETKFLFEFLDDLPPNCVVSLGSETIASEFSEYNKLNAKSLSGIGKIIYLSPGQIQEDAIAFLHERELSHGGSKSLEEIKKLFLLKKSNYESLAQITLSVNNKSVIDIVKELVVALK